MHTPTLLLALLGAAALTAPAAAQTTYTAGSSPPPPPSSALPQPPPAKVDNVGNSRQWVFGLERVATLAYSRAHAPMGPTQGEEAGSGTLLNLFGARSRLSIDTFVTQGVSIGGSVTIPSSPFDEDNFLGGANEARRSSIYLAPRIGFAHAFNSTLGFWGRLGASYGHEKYEASGGGTAIRHFEILTNRYGVSVDAMGMLSPVPHVALLGGPYFEHRWSYRNNDEGVVTSSTANEIGLSFSALLYF